MKPDTCDPKNPRNFHPAQAIENHTGGELLKLWKAGDQQAAAILVDRYFARLLALISCRSKRRDQFQIPASDIVQSAMGSFFAAVRSDRIQIQESAAL